MKPPKEIQDWIEKQDDKELAYACWVLTTPEFKDKALERMGHQK